MLARLCAMFFAANKEKDAPAKAPIDFLPYVEKPKDERQSPDQMMEVMKGWAAALAGG